MACFFVYILMLNVSSPENYNRNQNHKLNKKYYLEKEDLRIMCDLVKNDTKFFTKIKKILMDGPLFKRYFLN